MCQVYWLAVLMLSTSYNSIKDKQSKMIPSQPIIQEKPKFKTLKCLKITKDFWKTMQGAVEKAQRKDLHVSTSKEHLTSSTVGHII
jgi:hypothetical protein